MGLRTSRSNARPDNVRPMSRRCSLPLYQSTQSSKVCIDHRHALDFAVQRIARQHEWHGLLGPDHTVDGGCHRRITCLSGKLEIPFAAVFGPAERKR
jgi:hypothetical protein